jgi:hypothetical protein
VSEEAFLAAKAKARAPKEHELFPSADDNFVHDPTVQEEISRHRRAAEEIRTQRLRRRELRRQGADESEVDEQGDDDMLEGHMSCVHEILGKKSTSTQPSAMMVSGGPAEIRFGKYI